MKEIINAVMERSGGLCENCFSPGTEFHHVIKGHGKRKQHENKYSVILLCFNCHRGTWGVHGREGRPLDLELKRRLQSDYRALGYEEEKIRRLMGGKLY